MTAVSAAVLMNRNGTRQMPSFSIENALKENPPVAVKKPHTIKAQGEEWNDPYFWLREKTNPEVIDYLKAENAYAEKILKPTEDFQKKLYDEMLGRIKEDDLSVPVKRKGYFYYTRTEKGKAYSIYCRKKGSLEAAEEVLLDVNVMAKGVENFELGVFGISPDQKLLAYSWDNSGAETYTLQVKNLEDGTLLSEKIPATGTSLVWAADSRTFFYSTLDAMKRPYRLFRHALGTHHDQDVLVYEEKDERFFLAAGKSKDEKIIFLSLHSKNTSEELFLSAENPLDAFQLLAQREEGIEYSAEHDRGRFLIVTNWQAVNFRVMETAINQTERVHWKEWLAHRPEVKLEGLDTFKNYVTLYERTNGNTEIRVIDLKDRSEHKINFGEEVYASGPGSNPEYDSEILRVGFASLLTPSTVYDYNMRTRERELKKQQEVLGGYDSSLYASARIFAVSHDGVKIPISLVYKKGLKRDGSAPAWLYGYGSYGISIDPVFSSARLSLLDRGFVYAIAHIRGGGDMGRPWYDAGKLKNKKNTFLDFIACAEFLIREKYTSAERLGTSGGSAGGLLMGGVLNLRPDLFRAAILDVPFVDALNTMLDASLPLTVTEYDEWGNPQETDFFNLIRSYAPYENIKPQNYPHMLVTGGLNDPRVQYWEPAKWTAKLRATKTDRNLLLMIIHMGSGHGGPSGRYAYLREVARDYAFMISLTSPAVQ